MFTYCCYSSELLFLMLFLIVLFSVYIGHAYYVGADGDIDRTRWFRTNIATKYCTAMN